jgi:hypothetical protein
MSILNLLACSHLDFELQIAYKYTMPEDDPQPDLDELREQNRRMDEELRALQERGLGQHGPRICAVLRPALPYVEPGGAERVHHPQIIVGWDKGAPAILDEASLPRAAAENLATSRSKGMQTEIPWPNVAPYRVKEVLRVVQGEGGRLHIVFETIDGQKKEGVVTSDELTVLQGFAHPTMFTEYADTDAAGGTTRHPLEGRHRSVVLPNMQDDASGIVLLPEPVFDTAAGTNEAAYYDLVKQVVTELIAADIMLQRSGASYFQSALKPLDLPLPRRVLLDTLVDILTTGIEVVDGQIKFKGILGGMNRGKIQSSLGVNEMTAEGLQRELASFIAMELREAEPEQLMALLSTMRATAELRAHPVQ